MDCKVEECQEEAKIKGFCKKHYAKNRWQAFKEQYKQTLYDPRPFWEKWDQPKLKEAVDFEYKWLKEKGYRSAYFDIVIGAYNRRFKRRKEPTP